MRRWMTGLATLACAASCNQIFSLQETQLIDSRYRGCPAPGETPTFTTLPQPISSGAFPFDYTFDEARTFAVASIVNTGIVEGPIDSADLVKIDLPADSGDALFSPRLTPEGDELFMVVRDANIQWTLRLYRRAGPMTWLRGETVAALQPAEQISTPSRRSSTGQRRMVRRNPTGTEFVEYAEQAGSWSVVGRYDRASLGLTTMLEDPQLSPDGLRLVFATREIVGWPIQYTDRASIDDPFGPARVILQLTGDAEAQDPILTQDCVRLYAVVYPGLIYVEQ